MNTNKIQHVSSPALRLPLSPRPNPSGAGAKLEVPEAKPLTILRASKSSVTIEDTIPQDVFEQAVDQSEALNDQVREQFVVGGRLGEGTYAIVYAGYYRQNPEHRVAIKKIKLNAEFKDGIAMDAIREIKFLQELEHPNIIKLHAVFSTKDQNLSLVLEHLPYGDLEALWKNKDVAYGAADIKAWAIMLANAVWFCHANHVLHRDIKGNNILIGPDGGIKLADFGLARGFADPGRPMTNQVITRFYRPPELLYGARYYSGAVDIWSMGIVISELCIRNFLVPSNTDIEQITAIEDIFGTPTDADWPFVSTLPLYKMTFDPANIKRPRPHSWWLQTMGILGSDGIDLLRGMLTMNPLLRLDSQRVLYHPYFANAPRPTMKEMLPRAGGGLKQTAEDHVRMESERVERFERGDKVARKLDFGAMRN
ncbi:serine/threonine-protein kinase crk1 [Lophiotrema nucula]|uniref:Serine/threonine-protein kinase crk1 n=1 Tax=Lophiotrema nucula TaxID=690887 RepID=A0A6A5YYT5_9PLEO|nr:serine/threonine-protein kinase crk1 [Lophiotrema nucula]